MSMAKRIGAANFNLLVIDTENKVRARGLHGVPFRTCGSRIDVRSHRWWCLQSGHGCSARMQFVSTGFAEEIAKGASGRYYYLPNVRMPRGFVAMLLVASCPDASGRDAHVLLGRQRAESCSTLAHVQASDQAIAMAASSAMAEAKAA